MLNLSDLFLIGLTTTVCTAGVTTIALIAQRLNRRGSITSQFTVVVAAAIASVALSTIAIAAEMLFSAHELKILLWIVATSALMSLTGAWITARTARISIAALRDSARHVGDGVRVSVNRQGWKEFGQLSAELSDTSERLSEARIQLEQLDASRRELFAWISHDLRTPLTGVRALAEALDAGVADDPADYIRRISVQAETMNRMVDDLFELSRLNAGAIRLHEEPVELLDLVSDAVTDIQQPARERHIRITHSGMIGRTLSADPHQLKRAIVNLLTNSVRHAPEGSEVLVSARQTDDNRTTLSVLDRGYGVPESDLERMFEIGWRASPARTPNALMTTSSGAGLGLAIVKGIVEAHDGSVDAEHTPDGFRLNIRLPTAPNVHSRAAR